MKNVIKGNKAITLIALVITIVVLIILAAVLINLTLGENGLFTRSRLAKQKYEYAEAKEIVDLKLVDIHAECMIEGKEYTLKKISEEMTAEQNITIVAKYFKSTSLKKDNVSESNVDLKGIVVSANVHPEYEFLIGEKGETVALLGVTTEELPETWTGENLPEEFLSPEQFEIQKLGTIVVSGNNTQETNPIGEFTPSITKINTTRISVTLPEIQSVNEIIGYFWLINNDVVDYGTQANDEVTYSALANDFTFAAIAVDKKGNTRISNTINQDNEIVENTTYSANSTSITNFTPIITDAEHDYFTANVPEEVTENSSIKGYFYLLNGEIVGEYTEEESYTFEDLNLATTYQVEIIAVDENGSLKKSSKASQATAEGIFLYRYGNEYTSLTGGWEAAAIKYDGEDSQVLATDQYTFSRLPEGNPDHLYFSVPKSPSGKLYNSVLKLKNSINLATYSKICVDCTANVGSTSGAQIVQFIVKYGNGAIVELSGTDPNSNICYTSNFSTRTIKGWDYSELSGITDIYILVQSSWVYSANCNIYKCWLEK